MSQQYKECSTCKQRKGVEAFYHNSKNKDGYAGKCKSCQNNTLYAKNPKKLSRHFSQYET